MSNFINVPDKKTIDSNERGIVKCDRCKESFNSFMVLGWSFLNKKIICNKCINMEENLSNEKNEQIENTKEKKTTRTRIKIK